MEQTLNAHLSSSSACGCRMFFRTLIQQQATEGRLCERSALWTMRLWLGAGGGGKETYAVLNFSGSARSSFWFED
jgi:hypothetical protein